MEQNRRAEVAIVAAMLFMSEQEMVGSARFAYGACAARRRVLGVAVFPELPAPILSYRARTEVH